MVDIREPLRLPPVTAPRNNERLTARPWPRDRRRDEQPQERKGQPPEPDAGHIDEYA